MAFFIKVILNGTDKNSHGQIICIFCDAQLLGISEIINSATKLIKSIKFIVK